MHAVVKGWVFNPLMYQQVPLEHHHLAAVSAVFRRLGTEPWKSEDATGCLIYLDSCSSRRGLCAISI